MRKAVEIITDQDKAKVLVDPMRREIVRLLGDGGKTENELAKTLGLSDPSVGHHLKILKDSGLIRMARQEVETHGIMQKFYESNAQIYFVDSRKMPLEIERYFMPISLERVRGIIGAIKVLFDQSQDFSAEEIEEFAKAFTSAIVDVASKFSKPWNGRREELMARVYREALKQLLSKPDFLPDNVRTLLIRAHKARA